MQSSPRAPFHTRKLNGYVELSQEHPHGNVEVYCAQESQELLKSFAVDSLSGSVTGTLESQELLMSFTVDLLCGSITGMLV